MTMQGASAARPTDQELTLTVERDFVGSWFYLAERDRDTETFGEAGLRGFITGFETPLLNAVIGTRVDADGADTLIERTLARFADRHVPMSWWVLPSDEPADLAERLAAHGLVDAGPLPGMAIDLGALPAAPRVPGLTIERVAEEEDLAAFISVALPALEAPDAFGTLYTRVRVREGFGDDGPIRDYLGRLDGGPVATATLMMSAASDGIAGIYNVATEASHRRRGLGSALTVAALEDARRLGLRIGTLQSSAAGHAVYLRLGYRDVCTFGLYVFDPSH